MFRAAVFCLLANLKNDFISLFKDGRNHSLCCMKQNLPEQCLPFCLGYVPQPLWKNQSSCLLYMEEIVDCMEEGHGKLSL